MIDFLIGHLNGIIIFLTILLLISLSNLYSIPNPAGRRRVRDSPFVSILLPARNEAENIGGHESIKDSIADDLALTRQVKNKCVKWILLNGKDLVRCRMYRGSRQAWDGFGKNLFSVFDYRILPHLFIWLWTAVVFIELPILLVLHAFNPVFPPALVYRSAFAAVLALFLWLAMLAKFGLPLHLAILYPLQVALSAAAALRSMVLHLHGRGAWKGRTLEKVRIRSF